LENRLADVNYKTPKGTTALLVATHQTNGELVELLLDYGADPCIKNNENLCAKDIARNEILDIFEKRGIECLISNLPKKFRLLESKDEISKCKDGTDLATFTDINEFDKVYMIENEEGVYDCYSIQDVKYILSQKNKNLSDKERMLAHWNVEKVIRDFEL
jgi:hypothetical protein